MTTLYDYDPFDLGGNMDSAILQQPAGIGIAPEQAPAPVSSMTPTRTRLGAREDMLAGMSPSEKFFGAMGDVGRGLQGKPLRIDAMVEEKRKERLIKLQEVKMFAETTKDVLETADKLTGEARTKFIQAKADQLNSISPGSGDMLTNFTDDPEYGKMLLKYAQKSPTLKTALETGGMKAARDLMKSEKGAERIRSEVESAAFPSIRTKLQTLGLAAQDLLPPDRYKQMMDDGFISPAELSEINAAASGHEKFKAAALSAEELNLANRNEDATYGLAGMATSKTAQEVLKKKAEATKGVKPGTLTEIPLGGKNYAKGAYDPDKSLFPQAEHDANGFAILGKGTKEGMKLEFPATSSEVTRDVGGKPHKIKVQLSPSGEVRETDMGEIAPPPKEKNPIKDIISSALKDGKAPKADAKAPKAESLPPEIASKLKAGVNTTLSDGSVWTLEGGKPKKVK